uniref:Uncharacterized protein n=1 Tax=Anguilla anguilla TaxID=7936 RepID=A0A0E9P7Y3_ANGAN
MAHFAFGEMIQLQMLALLTDFASYRRLSLYNINMKGICSYKGG